MHGHYRHIVFDIDGTLLDTEQAVLHSLQDVVRLGQGRALPLDDLKFALGITGADALRQLGFDDPDAAQRLWDRRMAAYADSVRVFPGVEPVLAKLKAAGCRAGIVTSKTRAEYRTDFAPFGLEGFFTAVVCADDTARHKPCGDPLLRYLQAAGAAAEQTLYVGDSIYDSQCARAARVDFALAGWGTQRTDIPFRHYLQKPQALLQLV